MIAPTAVANARPLDRSRGLGSALRASFVVNLDCVAIQRSNALGNSGEPVRLTVHNRIVSKVSDIYRPLRRPPGSTPETVPSITASLY